MQAQDVIAEINRQIDWLQRTGRTPTSIGLGARQYEVLERAMEAPSCESGLTPVASDTLHIHGLPVHRANSPSDVNVAAD